MRMPRPSEVRGAAALRRGPRHPRPHRARRASSSERFRPLRVTSPGTGVSLRLVPCEPTQGAAEQEQREAARRHERQIGTRERKRALLLGRRQLCPGHSAGTARHLRLDRRNQTLLGRRWIALKHCVVQRAAQVRLRIGPVEPTVVGVVLEDLLRCPRKCTRHPDNGRTRQSGNCCDYPSPTHLPLPSVYRSLASYNDSGVDLGTRSPPPTSPLFRQPQAAENLSLNPPVSFLDVG